MFPKEIVNKYCGLVTSSQEDILNIDTHINSPIRLLVIIQGNVQQKLFDMWLEFTCNKYLMTCYYSL